MKNVSKKSLGQFLKYNIGGLLYFWSAWAIITFLTDSLGLVTAYLLGNFVGLTLNYLVQRFWAFDGTDRNFLNSGWRFAVLTVINLAIGYVILRLLTDIGVPLWLAQFISAAFFTLWNWVWYKYWVFSGATRKSMKKATKV